MESSIDQFAVGNESNSAIIGDSMKPNGKIVYTIKCTPHPIQPKPRHSSNVNIPTAEGTVNYILGRPRPSPQIEHVSDSEENNDDSAIPSHIKKNILYSADGITVSTKFWENTKKSHMQKYFSRNTKEEKNEKALRVSQKPYTKRKKKPKNTYETKAMKLSRVKNEPIRRTDINAILKNSR